MKKNKVPLIYYGVLKNKRSEKKEIGKKWRKTFLNIFKNFAKAIIPPSILLFITIGVPITTFNVSLAMTGFGAFYLAYVGYETINAFDNKNNNSMFAVQNIFRNLHDAINDIGNLFVLSSEYLKKDSEISKISNGLDATLKEKEHADIKPVLEEKQPVIQKNKTDDPLQKIKYLYSEARKLPYELKCKYTSEITDAYIEYKGDYLSFHKEDEIVLTNKSYETFISETDEKLSNIEKRLKEDVENYKDLSNFNMECNDIEDIIQDIKKEQQVVLGRKKH